MYELVIFILLKFLVERKGLGVSECVFSWADDNNVGASKAINVVIKCLSVVEVAEHQSEVPVSHHASIQQKLRCDHLIRCEKLQRYESKFTRPPVSVYFKSCHLDA